MEKKSKNLWNFDSKYQAHAIVTAIDITNELGDTDERIVYIEDLEKRKKAYGICGECKEPGTGQNWCQPCNAKRFKDNFKNWTSGNKDIDELIQQLQLNAVHRFNFLEWISFEKFQNITYIAEGGFDIHNAGFVHKDFHSGNLLFYYSDPFISDLGMCQPENKQIVDVEGVYGPTANEMFKILNKWNDEIKNIEDSDDSNDSDSENTEKGKNNQNNDIYSQIRECDKIGKKKFKNRSNEDKSNNIQTHPQAIYTSRLLNFKNLPKPVNSSDLSSFQFNSVSAQLSELDN
ncbi:hypothetical protein RclHR1_00690032 [Rhizophagus clarus]|uniref:Protein kinase domain-containing protein n=1 Tax=Rhizophagus clarus TaxID=94130 RepID=A0A2Z6SBE1_9GLOM|nr:hypothetical protein RclHR1_00690032 [Rhizophagus clarus]